MWQYENQLIDDWPAGQTAYGLALNESSNQLQANIAASNTLVHLAEELRWARAAGYSVEDLLTSDEFDLIEELYPIFLEDVKAVLRGVGSRIAVISDLSDRAQKAKQEAVDDSNSCWLTCEDILWRPDVVEKDEHINWRYLKSLYTRKSRLRRLMMQQPIIPSKPHDPHYRLNQAVDDQLVHYGYMLLTPDLRHSTLKLLRRLRKWWMPPIGLGWRENLWMATVQWEFEQWINRIHDKSGFSRRKSFMALFKLLPLPFDESDNDRRAVGDYFRGGGLTLHNKQLASIAWGWLTVQGLRLDKYEWQRFANGVYINLLDANQRI